MESRSTSKETRRSSRACGAPVTVRTYSPLPSSEGAERPDCPGGGAGPRRTRTRAATAPMITAATMRMAARTARPARSLGGLPGPGAATAGGWPRVAKGFGSTPADERLLGDEGLEEAQRAPVRGHVDEDEAEEPEVLQAANAVPALDDGDAVLPRDLSGGQRLPRDRREDPSARPV